MKNKMFFNFLKSRLAFIHSLSILFFIFHFPLSIFFSCSGGDERQGPDLGPRDSLPVLKSVGVSTLISDSGVIRYKMISEDWYVYDKTEPTYWSFRKGLFMEKFNEAHHVDAFISADTAYYYDQRQLWELRGRVLVRNLKGETFKTTLLYWDQTTHRIYSPAYMEIDGETNKLSGYDFNSNEQLTDYLVHQSKGQFPMVEDDTPPEPQPTPQPAPETEPETETNPSTVSPDE